MELNFDPCIFHFLKLEMMLLYISDMGFHNKRLNSNQFGNNRLVEKSKNLMLEFVKIIDVG